jgi:hypothetical protein
VLLCFALSDTQDEDMATTIVAQPARCTVAALLLCTQPSSHGTTPSSSHHKNMQGREERNYMTSQINFGIMIVICHFMLLF